MKLLKTTLVGFLSGCAGAYVFSIYFQAPSQAKLNEPQYHVANYENSGTHSPTTATTPDRRIEFNDMDFSSAASKAIPSVVYIKSISQKGTSYSYWDLLFNNVSQKQVSSGSGVIFSSDGYILTNNHVVELAEKIQVIYNKKAYKAALIGTDPSTDLAVLKIEEDQLPPIPLGSSRNLLVGAWVMAVGNPLSLSSTVTAGIVSAKGRRINIVEDKFPIESFIQTDAAINPGNSGGALIDKNGKLVGINTAILSRTGSYTGYAFAVPVDIAKKVFADIVKYGVVQKPFFGAKVEEYNFQNIEKYNLSTTEGSFNGVLLTSLEQSGAAQKAGLALGDIITKVDDVKINSESEFEEELSYHSPGHKVKITYLRNEKEATTTITLVNKNGTPEFIKRELHKDATIGAILEEVEYGVKVISVEEDGLFKKLKLPEGYTIVSINRHQVKDPKEVIRFFKTYKGRVTLYGITASKRQLPIVFYLQ